MANSYRVVKGKTENVKPSQIRKRGDSELVLVWPDGHESVYPFSHLRRHCQCALCIDERSGAQVLDPASVPEGLKGLKVFIVGQYALGIEFGDGHNTGIFPFDRLRKICPCGACGRERRPENGFLSKDRLRSRS